MYKITNIKKNNSFSIFNIGLSFISYMIISYLLLFNQTLFAQQASANTKKKTYLIGDWIPVDLTVDANKNVKIFFPDFNKQDSSNTSNIEIANASGIDTVKDGINYRYHQLVNFICFDTGKVLIQPIPILVINQDKIDTIYSDAVVVHVAGVAIDTSKDIKPIKGPIKVPYTLKELAPYLLTILGILLLILAIVWFIRKRKKDKLPKDLKYILPPHIWALQELDKIKKQKLWQNGDVKAYYSQISDVLRNYIELRFKLPAMEQTSDEIMESMHKGVIKQKLKQPIHNFLMLSDFVKFAKAQPDLNDNENAIQVVEEFINQTKPIENNTPKNENKN
jgi:LPXTG-motif cell wall-anchored protein